MAQLRHVAIAVPSADMEKTVRYYEEVFGLRRVKDVGVTIQLTDGVMNLAIVDKDKEPTAKGDSGLYHIGFIVDDVAETRRQIEARNGSDIDADERLANRRKIQEAQHGTENPDNQRQEQRKLRGPDGIKLDIANAEYARLSWNLPDPAKR